LRARNDTKQERKCAPDAAEFRKHSDGGVGLGEKLFGGLAGIEEDADGIELGQID